MRSLYVLFALCIVQTHALYTPSGSVIQLNDANFATKLQKGVWMVEFYAPWCGHCKALVPEWEKAAKALSGIVNVGALDADAHKQLGGQYGVQGFPTIKFMYHDGTKVKAVDYNGGRTAKDVISFAMDKARALALKRIGQKASAGASSSSHSSSSAGAPGGGGFYPAASKVVNLGEANFDAEVLNSEELWFVEFYAPWCGHCKQLKPEYISAAKELVGKARLGAINCDEENALCGKYGIKGFPTIKFFGTKKARPTDYQGGRDSVSLVAYATERWAKNAPVPEIRELTDVNVFADHCTGDDDAASAAKQLCFVAFLPDILDTQAAGRNAYIAVLKQVAEAFKDRPYSYFWSQGGAQPGLEANVGVGGFGYPAMVAFSPKRSVYVPLKGALDLKQITEFVGAIRTGAQRGVPIHGNLASVASVTPWDGRDGQLVEEEEFSLDDIMNEEL